jgi:hypothetical protein
MEGTDPKFIKGGRDILAKNSTERSCLESLKVCERKKRGGLLFSNPICQEPSAWIMDLILITTKL